ncbi:SUKH-3 domain-containing protein [Micromonospora sp. NPDC093244]|uniref:SUKH-3 domain-containing protein n=1 Tax=Micromonospora sp. NPDC093244 TaxID=3155071 RepID=UPI00341C95C5
MAEAHDWTSEVVAHLTTAGWQPGRRIDLRDWAQELATGSGFQLHPAAATFLAEFGGINVPRIRGLGQDVASVAFELDPRNAEGRRDWFRSLGCPARGELYPIGDAGGGHAILAIDEESTVFMLFGNECRRIGTGAEAVANLVTGRRP